MAKYDYTPNKISRMSEKAVRKAYTELRKIANKRAKRLESSGIESVYSGVYAPTIAQLGDIESIRGALADVSRRLRDKRSSITGQKEYARNMLQTFHEHGYDFVTEKNLKTFGEYMEWARARSGANDRVFKSDKVAELFEQTEKKKISVEVLKRNFDRYLEEYSKTGNITLTTRRKEPQRSSEDYISKFSHARSRRK